MNLGLRNMQMSRAAVPPIRMRPLNAPSGPAPRVSAASDASRDPSSDPRAQSFAGDLHVVERHLDASRELLSLLVPLAGYHEHIAVLSQSHGPLYGRPAIDLGCHRRSTRWACRGRGPPHDLGDDRFWVLRAGVIRGDK